MEDAEFVNSVAADYVRQAGTGAPRYLRERRSIARARGDKFSAEAWSDIAKAASAILLALKRDPPAE